MRDYTLPRVFSIKDDTGEREITLGLGDHIVGRDASSDVVLSGIKVSRRHLRLSITEYAVFVDDLGSSNGTCVNGARLARRCTLAPQDEIQLGEVTVRLDGEAAAGAPAAGAFAVVQDDAAHGDLDGAAGDARAPSRVERHTSKNRTPILLPIMAIMLGAGAFYAYRAGMFAGAVHSLSASTKSAAATGETAEPPAPESASAAKPKAKDQALAQLELDVRRLATEGALSAALAEVDRFDVAHPEAPAAALRAEVAAAVEAAVVTARREYEDVATRERIETAEIQLTRRLRRLPASHPAVVKLAARLGSGTVRREVDAEPAPLPESPPVAVNHESPASAPARVAPGPSAEELHHRRMTAESAIQAARSPADVAFSERRFDAAATGYAELEALCKRAGSASKVAAEVDRRRRICERIARLERSLAAAITADSARFTNVAYRGGSRAAVVHADTSGIAFESAGVRKEIAWPAVSKETFLSLVGCADLALESNLDAAALFLFNGDPAAAHKILRSAEQEEIERARPELDRVLADAAGMDWPKKPFVWVGDAYVSGADYERLQAQKIVESETLRLSSAQKAEREAAYARLEALGDVAKSAYQRGLATAKLELAKKVAAGAAWKKLEVVLALAKELDAARDAALEVIMDEASYPYPHETSELDSLHAKAQVEVNKRLAVVRKIWDDERSCPIGRELREARERLTELETRLAKLELGMGTTALDPLLHLPASESATVRTIARDHEERLRIDESLAWMQLNATDPCGASAIEAEQVRITNDYRMMMARHAVRIHPLLVVSARGHSQDMARLGFFDHINDKDPAKRTPEDRMRLAGFSGAGGSENIAVSGGGAAGAHRSWLHSAGHHRNILAKEWRLLGSGNDGSLWTQNFSVSAHDEADLFTPKKADSGRRG
jgi:uncharacterized protein YkwD